MIRLEDYATSHQIRNPASVVTAELVPTELLARIAFSTQGIKTGDDERWRNSGTGKFRCLAMNRWRFVQGTVEDTGAFLLLA